jgi:methionine-rich copper-binding protein CopC
MRRFAPAFAAVMALAAGPAFAHAFLESATPRVGSHLSDAPAEVRLSFSEPVEPAFSSVSVAGPPGFRGSAPARTTPGDAHTLISPLNGPLPRGRYLVRWRVVSVDSHATQGTFQFEVAP